jgi:hypothetical protein
MNVPRELSPATAAPNPAADRLLDNKLTPMMSIAIEN